MPRRITTDTFLTITGPGINLRVARALADSTGKVAVWTKPHGRPQHVFQLPDLRKPLGMRGTLLTINEETDGEAEVTYRRRGVSCSWAICKGKFSTRAVAAWWPDDDSTDPGPTPVAARAVQPAARPRRATVAERREAQRRARVARQARDKARRMPPVPVPEPVPEPEPEPELPAPVPVPLADLDLNGRTINALAAAGITTLPQLAEQNPASLEQIRGIGPKAAEDLAALIQRSKG